MDAQNKFMKSTIILICFAVSSCANKAVNINNGFISDKNSCRPSSNLNDEVVKSQLKCHQGVAGDGVHVNIATTTWNPSFRSDTTKREITSIFISPGKQINIDGAMKFDAYYSEGLYDLAGKTGCVGILEDGSVEIKKHKNKRFLKYDLQFKLVSPNGWAEDCDQVMNLKGKVNFNNLNN